MVKSNCSRPPLEASLTVLKQQLRQDVLQQSPAHAAELYRAAIHLLGALKQDQARLCRVQRECKNNDQNRDYALCPSYDKIPAISAVVNDDALFLALVQCLQTATSPGESGDTNAAVATVFGRKRSLSMTGESSLLGAAGSAGATKGGGGGGNASLKAAKLAQHHLSPGPQARHKVAAARRQHKPSFDVRVFAATCLYTAFQHLDHWPVPLVRAYAEDCFGPRLWVDLPQCAALVENLALVHRTENNANGMNNTNDENDKLKDDAALIAETYAKFESEATDGSNGSVFPPPVCLDEPVEKAAVTGLKRHASSMSSTSFESSNSRNGLKHAKQRHHGRNGSGKASDSGGDSERKKQSPSDNSKKKEDEGNSSSSGEEDQDDVVMTKSEDSSLPGKKEGCGSDSDNDDDDDEKSSSLPANPLYPISQNKLDQSRVRQRFFGKNLEAAHGAIVSTLTDRVDVKSKQNSNLLLCLPNFTSIPGVRCQIAANLEKWLQSPALAGLARTLFTSTVNNMKNTDPPLDEDLKAIDSIIAMRLKANQLNAHIGNVTAIARRIPVASVASHLYSKLLRDLLVQTDGAIGSAADHLKMIGAVHREIPPQISYDSIAVGLLTMLAQPPSSENVVDAGGITSGTPSKLRSDRARLVKKLRGIIRSLSSELGPAFDGALMIGALQSLDVSTVAWSARDEEDKARLMFQCVTMSVSPFLESFERSQLSHEDKETLRKSLASTRKILLEWCCTEYGPHFSSKRKRKPTETEHGDLAGAGEPVFSSILGPESDERRIPTWLNAMRCLLLLEDADSVSMKRFIFPEDTFVHGDESVWEEEIRRLRVCCQFGQDLNDELLWIVLRSASVQQVIDPDMSIQLLENLFQSCSRKFPGTLTVTDPNLVWEMYNLVLFTPPAPASLARMNSTDSEGEEQTSSGRTEKNTQEIPRLAYPGLWWRVTMLALAMCGRAPLELGTVMWEEHPTLRALITMVTTGRYRFPTIDCDEEARAEMKRSEQAARDNETNTAEYLFLPPKQKDKKKEHKGSRVSRRLLKQQEEKEATREYAERTRRKNLLRAAQKSIMLWDPDGPARKPPKEAVNLLFSVEELFELSNTFQRSTDPDFLLMTIGKTTRGAIERAYEWLIPIISTLPETIARLPSSASCFLLLRAYGTEGDERKQLKELSSPLLRHVKDSLNGKYGEADAVKAFDLLMADVASSKPDRRRCARRVLQDALARPNQTSGSPQQWMLNVLELDCAKALVGDAVKHMSTAASFEQGGVLRSLVVALEKHIAFAEQKSILVEHSFCDLLIRLISNRPSVFAAAMDAYADLRSLSVRVLHSDFVKNTKRTDDARESTPSVTINLFKKEGQEGGTIHLPLTLLQSICVVLSIWKDGTADEDQEAVTAINNFVSTLLCPDEEGPGNVVGGLASAKMLGDHSVEAVPVEFWIMLAKSRSDSLAKRAALSAPADFLPRLLLCSSLPRTSLLAMIDKLGRLGDAASEKNDLYANLMSPSALSEWDIGRVGLRRELARKLLGRLSAYLRIHAVSLNEKDSDISTTFLSWLTEECRSSSVKAAKSKQKKSKTAAPSGVFTDLATASSLLSSIKNDISPSWNDPDQTTADADLDYFKKFEQAVEPMEIDNHGLDMAAARTKIANCVESNKFIVLDDLFQMLTENADRILVETKSDSEVELVDLSIELIKCVNALQHSQRAATSAVLKWAPRLSSAVGKPELWSLLFQRTIEPVQISTSRRLLSNCMQSWSTRHVAQCMEWIMSLNHSSSLDLDYEGITLFLISSSGQPSAQIDLFTDFSWNDSNWASSKDFVTTGALIALKSLEQAPNRTVSRRHSLPCGFTLAFLLSRCGKKQLRIVCELVLTELAVPNAELPFKSMLEVLFLRLYLNFPHWMDLGSATARTTLMWASEKFSTCWVDWMSSFDDRIDDLLYSIAKGDLKSAKQLADLSRKQPLLILRKLPEMSKILMDDATIDNSSNQKGVIIGQNLSGKREVKFHGKFLKMCVQHWGYSYSEPLWVALLDVLSSMPCEVLFTCGVQVGLLDLLTIYVELVSIQLQLLSASKTARLKTKLNGAFTAFRQNNSGAWTEWLVWDVGDSQIRHLLMSCDFISPQEAMDCVKK